MNEHRTIKIYKGDEYKLNSVSLMSFISSAGIQFFKDFDVEIRKFSDDEWILKILKENNDVWEEVKFDE